MDNTHDKGDSQVVKRRMVGSCAASLGLVLLTGFGIDSPTSVAASTVKGATVVVAEQPQSPPNWFFPVINAPDFFALNLQIEFLMYRPLIYLNSNSSVNYQRSLATHISTNASGTRYVITLGDKYRWSNGRPVTAQDVVWTVELMKAASTPHSPWVFGGLGSGGMPNDWKSVSARGSRTVVIELAHPANPEWFIHNGLTQIFPVPQATWDRYPTNMMRELKFIESVGNTPTSRYYDVVDGPFRFDKWEPNDYWELVPNRHFGGHKATIGHLIFQYEGSSSAEFAALKDGAVSVGYLPASMIKLRNELPNDAISSSYLFAMNYVVPNLSPKAPGGIGKVFSQLYVRQALEMGIDQAGIIKTLYHGYGVPTDGPIPPKPASPYYDRALNQNPYRYNPTRGRALLEAHGWHMKHGVMTKGSQTLAFNLLYASGSLTEADTVQLLKSDWAQEGVRVTLEQMPFDQLFAELSQSDPSKWQMGYWGTGLEYQYNYYPTGGSMFAPNGEYNQSGYVSTTAKSLIDQTYLPGSAATIQRRMDAYQLYIAHQLPVLWMPWLPSGYSRVIGLNVHALTVHGTVKTFNPVTNYMYANYWTVSS